MNLPGEPQYRLYYTPLHFVVIFPQIQSLLTGGSSQLVIERASGRCFNTSNFNPLEQGFSASQLYYTHSFGMLGIISIENIAFLSVVTEADILGKIEDSDVYIIKKVVLYPLDSTIPAPSDIIIRQIESVTRVTTI